MKPRRTLPWEAWPAADRAMWDALVQQGGLLDDEGPLAHVRESTRVIIQRRYARWLGWLNEVDPEQLLVSPQDRATPERLLAWLDSMAALSPSTKSAFLDAPVRVLRLAAPHLDREAQLRVRRIAEQRVRRSTSLRKVGRVVSSAKLLEAGLELAGPLADAASTPLEAAKRRRDGTMVALLALMPMRRRAFAALELGRSVLVEGARIDIVLSETMTKNGALWEAPVPEVIASPLRRYIDEVRPFLMARGTGWHNLLWTDGRGAPLEPGYLAMRIVNATRTLIGVNVSPHLFRDAAATSLARLSPQHAQLIRPLLGHQSFGVAERHYIQASMIEAGRDYAAVIEQLRNVGQ